MTSHYENQISIRPAILTPETQQAIWFLGALIHIRAGADATGGRLTVVERQAERGLASRAAWSHYQPEVRHAPPAVDNDRSAAR